MENFIFCAMLVLVAYLITNITEMLFIWKFEI